MTAVFEKPVFVVGTPRSGTTLTANIIGNHPDFFMPGECHYFEVIAGSDSSQTLDGTAKQEAIKSLLQIYGLYNQPADQSAVDELFADPAQRRQLEIDATTFGNLFRGFMQLRLDQTNAQRWGNQAPKDIFHFEKILQEFPQAHFVICVRDCRDFLLSYKGRWKVSDHGERLQKLYHPVLTALLWRSTMKAVQRLKETVPSSQFTIVKYEDLVNQPTQAIASLCADLGVEFHHSMISDVGHNSSADVKHEGIFSTSVGQWTSGLNPAEIAIAQQINGATMVGYGYKLAKTSVLTWPVLQQWLSFPFRTIFALYENRRQRGPLLQYLLKRIK